MLNGTIVEDRREIANSFNNFFTSIPSKLNECDDGLAIEPIPKITDYIKVLAIQVFILRNVHLMRYSTLLRSYLPVNLATYQ